MTFVENRLYLSKGEDKDLDGTTSWSFAQGGVGMCVRVCQEARGCHAPNAEVPGIQVQFISKLVTILEGGRGVSLMRAMGWGTRQ